MDDESAYGLPPVWFGGGYLSFPIEKSKVRSFEIVINLPQDLSKNKIKIRNTFEKFPP